MKYNDKGQELPDDSPMESPVKFRRPPSIQELIAMHVKAAMQTDRKMGKQDEDDFDEDDEVDDIMTPYEIEAYAGEASQEIRKAEDTQRVLDKMAKVRNNKPSDGGTDGFRKDEEGTGRSGQSGKEDVESNKSGPKVAGAGKESKVGVADE